MFHRLRCSGLAAIADPRLPPHFAQPALAGLRVDRDHRSDSRLRRPNLPGQVENPRPQLLRVVDPVPRAITADDEAMRRANPQLLLDQQEKETPALTLDRTVRLLKAALKPPNLGEDHALRLVDYYVRRNEIARKSHEKTWMASRPNVKLLPL